MHPRAAKSNPKVPSPLLEPKAIPKPQRNADRLQALAIADQLEQWAYNQWARALRTCGQEHHPDAEQKRKPPRLFCHRRFCPVCRKQRQKRHFIRLKDRMDRLIQPSWRLLWMTLTAPHSSPLESRIEEMLQSMRDLIRSHAWKHSGGLKVRVGVVWGFEIDQGEDGLGHPHIHLLAASGDPAELELLLSLLQQIWMNHFSDSTTKSLFVEWLSSHPGDWTPRLHYLLKGTNLDVSWPPDVFDVAVMALSSGRQHWAALGLMRPRRALNAFSHE